MKKSVYILLLCIAALSCEEQHGLRLDSQEPKLLLECFAGLNDTTAIFLRATTPVTQKDSIPPDIANAVVEMTVDGVRREVHYASSQMGTVPAGAFFSVGAIAPGAGIEVSAAASGLEPVRSLTEMPVACAGLSPELVYDEHYEDIIISIPIPKEMEYLGLCVVEETISHTTSRKVWYEKDELGNLTEMKYGDDFETGTDSRITFEVPAPLFESDLEWAEVMEFCFDGRSLLNPAGSSYFALIGPSDLTSERKYEGRVRCQRDAEYTVLADDGTLIRKGGWSTRLKFIVINLSPEMYRFARARYEDENNTLGFIGLAPASFTYSNVRGGFGALGAFTVWVSGWYANPGTPSDLNGELYGAMIRSVDIIQDVR